jgi:probable F420-dependent oxidoreductase
MRLGLCVPLVNPVATPEYLRALATHAEALGFHSLWAGEHVVLFDDYQSRYPLAADGRMPGDVVGNIELEPFTSLTFLAAHTRRIRLGTGVCVLPQRNPVYAAKEAANVDWLSNGRLNFGVGVGWLAEEYRALGVPFARRGARCGSYLEVVKRLWCDPVSVYHDEFYDLPPCRFYPKPVQQPYPPIILGGDSEATFARVAEQGQGWYALGLNPEEVRARMPTLEGALRGRGRTRADINIYVCPYPHACDLRMLDAYAALGVDEVVLLEFPASVAELEDRLGNIAARHSHLLAPT